MTYGCPQPCLDHTTVSFLDEHENELRGGRTNLRRRRLSPATAKGPYTSRWAWAEGLAPDTWPTGLPAPMPITGAKRHRFASHLGPG